MSEAVARKRNVVTSQEKKGLGVQSLILIAVLLAAGAVLKLTVSSFLTFAGMKPNFMIAMYCLAIILTRPKVYQAAIIGIITGLISQIPMLNATPLVNIPSEFAGALVCGILLAVFMRIAPKNFSLQNVVFPLIITFVATVVSGYTFALIVGSVMNGLPVVAVFATYAVMVLGTAVMNCILVAILTPILKKALKLA
jgi:hypothetical protein